MISWLSHSFNALIMECRFQMFNHSQIDGEVYLCSANVKRIGTDDTLTNVTGDHLPGKSTADVEYLHGSFITITMIPEKLVDFFPNLKIFQWDSTGLTAISSQDLRPFPNLIAFYAAYNKKLESIDGNLFEHSPNLKLISLYNNEIQHVGHNLLTNMPNLEIVWFNLNPCINTNAFGTGEILELNRQLPISCPPLELPTTTIVPESCSAGCLELIEDNQIEISLLRLQVESQTNTIEEMRNAIAEMKSQIREIQASPCSC